MDTVKKTILITEHQNQRIHAFCKAKRITFSQLVRFFIDDIEMMEYDTLRTAMQTASVKTQSFIGSPAPPVRLVRKGSDGVKRHKWYSRMFA